MRHGNIYVCIYIPSRQIRPTHYICALASMRDANMYVHVHYNNYGVSALITSTVVKETFDDNNLYYLLYSVNNKKTVQQFHYNTLHMEYM